MKSFYSIKDVQKGLEKKEFSAHEVVAHSLERFKKYDGVLGSALEIFEPTSIMQASAQTGPLAGVPGLIKDNICQQGRRLHCASKILEGYSAPYDATVIARLKEAGAPLVGRANMDEFAMGSSTETSAFKKTANPWDVTCVPGGSSGGSIAAVAAGLVPWALGSETGGSVRQPAALCGIVGSKPTYGLVSRYGLVAYASSLDQIGVATRTVEDNARVLSVIAGIDPKDSTTRGAASYDFTRSLSGTLKPGLKIGIIMNALNAPGIDPEIKTLLDNAIAQLEKLGAEIVPLTINVMDYSAAVYFIISRAEAASNLARFDGIRYGVRAPSAHDLQEVYNDTRHDYFGPQVKQRILVGNYVLSAGHADAYYQSAKKVQAMMRQKFVEVFADVDLLFSPVSAIPAFKFGAFAENSLALDLQDYFTAAANLTGIPAIAVPCGFTKNGLPTAFQLMGPDFSEELIFHAAYAYEQVTEWHTAVPEQFI